MDSNLIHLIIAGVATVACVVVTALVWKRAQVKTVFWWIGLTLVPMAIYLAGLGGAAEGAARTLYGWWNALDFTPMEWVGLVLGGLSVLLMLGSRLIPSESAKDRREAAKAERQAAKVERGKPAAGLAPRAAAPAPQTQAQPPSSAPAKAAPAGADNEFDEISELLRKRGIN